ncbi:MAG: glycine cleavage system protein GcvH [Melioribacteraceae bacterium]|nr:glycine cleavage system protein GcvH [Melioribacteraceae bacterium]MCF8353082.1 glycine cleavage system protein GcvH [Melioribacteraceae bacterium]MCF8392772.1 glycine cleavage system protein GcvH [Melioribacteraceae bacterium]MCF8418303.1 glycine cleavage system protein GcvH [Melioribacteraceae bacterium]
MNIPEDLKYTNDHEWIKVEGSTGIIGITDFAQGELGDIVFIDIDPDQGEVGSGDTFGTIEAVKTVSDLFAPVSGKLVEVNEKLQDEPQLVNSDPYGDGWIAKFELTNLDELKNLMDAGAYKDQIGQ